MTTALLVLAVLVSLEAFSRSGVPRPMRRRLRELTPVDHAWAVLDGLLVLPLLHQRERARRRGEPARRRGDVQR